MGDLQVGQAAKVQQLQHLLGVGINFNQLLVQSRHLWYIVVPPLSLFLLQFDGDSSDWTPLNPLHQMCYIPSDLVAELLAGDDGYLFAHPLVGVEVIAQSCVVLLDDHPGGLLDRLGPDSTLRLGARLLREHSVCVYMVNATKMRRKSAFINLRVACVQTDGSSRSVTGQPVRIVKDCGGQLDEMLSVDPPC